MGEQLLNLPGPESMLMSLNLDSEQMFKLLDMYRDFITQTLHAIDIVSFLPEILNREEKSRIIQLHRKGEHRESTKFFLNILFQKRDEPGLWRSFKEALKDAGYKIILDVLSGKLAEQDHEAHCRIIHLFSQTLNKKIIPSELTSDLCARRVLNDEDCQRIRCAEKNEGYIQATMVLLDCIPRHRSNWYYIFLQTLMDTEGYLHLVKELDRDYLEKVQMQRTEASGRDDGSSFHKKSYSSHQDSSYGSIRENTLQAAGSAYQNNDLNAPNVTLSSIDDEFNQTYKDLSLSSLSSMSSSDLNPKGGSMIDRAFDAHHKPIQERVVEGAENMNNIETTKKSVSTGNANEDDDDDDEITHLKQIAQSSSNFSDTNVNLLSHSGSTSSMNKLGSQNVPPTSQSLPQDSSIEKSHMYDNKSIGVQLDTNVVDNLCESIDREFPNNSPLEPNIKREDKYSRADNQRPENQGDKEPFELRSYQEELARPALEGKNSIIVAPTGSGKTHVALKIIEEHFLKMKGKKIAKVAFIVEQNALADQQSKVCMKHLHEAVKLITGDSQRSENFQLLSEWLDKRDILVVTAMILVNSLANGDVRIQDFTLMVFDECHHTAYKHPFNQIMQQYMDIKHDPETDKAGLPQVVGLTASVGVGKAKHLGTAKEWVKKIMANLDADELATVRDERQELSKHVNIPEEDVVKVYGRTKDYFGRVLRKIMETVEKYMRTSEYAKALPNAENVLKPPAERGADQYTQWISGLWKETAKIDDQTARRFFITCRNYLDIFNKSLIVYGDARVTDALTLIREELTKWQENTKPDETDKKLQRLYEKSKPLLEHCEIDPEHDNPKLDKLKEMIQQAYTVNKDMRGIVFVKTRDLVKAIETWMKETQGLKELYPVKFVGAQASSDRGGMTKVGQDNTLEYFRGGRHKLIIATSVAEEGLDIQKCNLVIRYDHVTNEIAMVQSRGRGRAEDSKYVVLAEHGKGTAEKEELNIIRENLMNKAIIELQDDFTMDPSRFKEELERLQKQAKIERDLEAKTRGRHEMLEGEFELRCCRCSTFICFSSAVHKIQQAHHAAICRDLVERVNITKTSKPAFSDKDIKTGIGKLNCMKCAYDLGNVSIYKNIQFPVLKIASFLVVDNMDRKNLFKKWKQVPFPVKDLSIENLEEMADWPQLVD